MNTFDAKEYRDKVLKPASRGEHLGQLREAISELRRDGGSTAYAELDLRHLFALPDPLTDTSLRERWPRVESALNKSERSLPAAGLLKQLRQLLHEQGKDLAESSFWDRTLTARSKLLDTRLHDSIGQLRSEYPLGIVTAAELASRLAALNLSALSERDIVSAAKLNGLDIVPDLHLPNTELPDSIHRPWSAAMKHSEHRTILDVLLLHRPVAADTVRVVDSLSVEGRGVGLTDIDEARSKGEQGRDTDALQDARKLLSALKSQCADDSDLHRFVLCTIIIQTRLELSSGKPVLAVRDSAVRQGIALADASRLVHSIARSDDGPADAPTLDRVRTLLSEAQLEQAERTFFQITPDEQSHAEYIALSELVQERKRQKEKAKARYKEQIAAHDLASADAALREALSIDQADEQVLRWKEELPPHSPSSLDVSPDATGVLISWTAESDEDVRYRVVRTRERLPNDPNDGECVGSDVEGRSVVDPSAPVGARLGYAVFASRDGRNFSAAATSFVALLPPVSEVTAEAGPTRIRISWVRTQEAVGTLITRHAPDGSIESTEVSTGSSHVSEDLQTGVRYQFVLRAVYLLSTGRKLSVPITHAVIARGQASEVGDLEISGSMVRGREVMEATWSTTEGFETQLWAFPRDVDLQQGSCKGETQLAAAGGMRLSVTPSIDGSVGGSRIRALLPELSDIMKVVPLTVVDSGYLLGSSALAGRTPRPTDVTAEVFGSELRLSWNWPVDDLVVELAWQANGRSHRRRITRARYRAEGGAKLAGALQIEDLTLATIVRVDSEEWVSAPVPVPIESATDHAVRASYTLAIRKVPLTRSVRCDLEVSTEVPGLIIPVELVLKRGSVMPRDREDGERVSSFDLDFTSATTVTHTVTLRREKSPFWLRVFSRDAAIQLDHPPTAQLKG